MERLVRADSPYLMGQIYDQSSGFVTKPARTGFILM
jgi:hypothetical protein